MWIGLGGVVGVFLVLGLMCSGCVVVAMLINRKPAKVDERNEEPNVARNDEPIEEVPPAEPLAEQHDNEFPDPPGQRPFAVDPALANAKRKVYLSDLHEFAWKPGPGRLGASARTANSAAGSGAKWPHPRQRGSAAEAV